MAKILVVDDELSIRMGIREFAEYQGYEVEEAANGKEAVERCRQKDFDVIIMDIMMPEMDGYEAYKKIREIKDIPALMLSAKGEEYDKLQGFELGIDDYVVKPFSIRELMARIGVILQRNQKNKKKTERELFVHIYNNNCTNSMKHWRKNEEVCGFTNKKKTTIL